MTTQSEYHRKPFLVFTKGMNGECLYPGCGWFVKLSPDPQCDSIPYTVEGVEDFTQELREHQHREHSDSIAADLLLRLTREQIEKDPQWLDQFKDK